MINLLRKFGKAHKGAELVEIILGVVISIGLLAIATTYIYKVILEHAKTAQTSGSLGIEETTTN